MDPISLVVAAVVLGASAGLTEAASQVVRDAYTGLKALLSGRAVDVSGVERKPKSETQRAALTKTLTDTPQVVDDEVLAAARAVTDAVAAHDPEAARLVGVSLRDVQAEFVKIGSVTSSGDGVVAEGVRLAGGFTVEEVRAGGVDDHPSPR